MYEMTAVSINIGENIYILFKISPIIIYIIIIRIRKSENLESFKKKIKTCLFEAVYK